MTNAQIILNTSIELMKAGILKSTGNKITLVNGAGEKVVIDEPETIHTFAAWKSLGFSVKKGQKAKTSFKIWKHTNKKGTAQDDNGNEVEIDLSNMYMVTAFFFTADQVEPAKVKTA